MAKNKPLNPMAPPYEKTPQTPPYLYASPQFTPHYRIFQPLVPYNVHSQPLKSFPRPLPPPSKQKKNFPLTPVPSGPRNSKFRLPGRGRRVNTAEETMWRPKCAENKATAAVGFDENKRWKNRRCGYHQILQMELETTSVMIKNIPNEYTRELLILILDNHCKMENDKLKESGFASAYDYLYLPIDFTNGVNAGFAFVNFTNSKAAFKFRDEFDGKRWDLTNSRKVARIFRARIQGKEALINNCRRMDFSNGSDGALPVLFDPPRDGSGRVISQMFKLGKFIC